MKIDVLLIPMSARYAEMRAAAPPAEEPGFDNIWTWDHLRDLDGRSGPGGPKRRRLLWRSGSTDRKCV